MNKHAIALAGLCLCILPATHAQAESTDDTAAPTITVTKLDITDQTLKLSYEIRNTSEEDVWILVGFGQSDTTFEVLIDEDDRTLLMQTRLEFPMIYISLHNLHGRYVLLRAGQTRTESVTLPIPVHHARPFGGGGRKQVLGQATRLAIKIGYYAGDLRKMIWEVIEKPEAIVGRAKIGHDKLMNYYFTGPLEFNRVNEILKERDEEILVPYTDQNLEYEKILQAVVEDLAIPYDEKYSLYTRPESPDIPHCTRIEIEFCPSMLEYYFPYPGQQNLLNVWEQQTLRSLQSTIVDDQQEIEALIDDINETVITDGVVRQTTLAHVVCYREAEPLTSFNVFNDNCIVTEAHDRYIHREGLNIFRRFTLQIRPFELRIQCAANLRNLWRRLRLCREAIAQIGMLYPAAAHWGDAMVRACQAIHMSSEDIVSTCVCPSVEEARKHLANCHYAMNPNCKYESPTDMVLLFETKAGWNQHGGPELFTFDNHDPKGGCVLLNDGTVKFIRTPEELQQLRWK